MTKLVKPQNWEKAYTFVHFRALPQGKQWGAVSTGLDVQDPGEARGLETLCPSAGTCRCGWVGKGTEKVWGCWSPSQADRDITHHQGLAGHRTPVRMADSRKSTGSAGEGV